MAITVLSDVILTNQVLEGGIKGRHLRKNERTQVFGGAQFINIGWQQTLREYDLAVGPIRRETWQIIEALFEITEGGAHGFLLQDPKDSFLTSNEGIVGGLTSTTFQLYKRYWYTVGGRAKDRKITRPKADGFQIYVNWVWVDPADYTLDATTGIVTIPSAPAYSTVTWVGNFYVPVHFTTDQIDWEMPVWGPDPDSRFIQAPTVTVQEIRE